MLSKLSVTEILPELAGDFLTLTLEEVFDVDGKELETSRRVYGNCVIGWFDIKNNMAKLNPEISQRISEEYLHTVYKQRGRAELNGAKIDEIRTNSSESFDHIVNQYVNERASQMMAEELLNQEIQLTFDTKTSKVKDLATKANKKEERNMLKNGTWVKVKNTGTSRHPIAERYVGRTGVVVGIRTSGNATLAEIEIHDRVTPLVATKGSLEIL